MSSRDIERVIAQAKQYEQRSGSLKHYVKELIDDFHPSIALPEANTEASIYRFLVHYIELVPQYLGTLEQAGKHNELSGWIWPVTYLCERYFVDQANQKQGGDGNGIPMANLLDSAYLAHRLLEELNDVLYQRTGQLALPMDLTTANVIVYDVIGDPLAVQLDEMVQLAIDSLLEQPATANVQVSDRASQSNAVEATLATWCEGLALRAFSVGAAMQ